MSCGDQKPSVFRRNVFRPAVQPPLTHPRECFFALPPNAFRLFTPMGRNSLQSFFERGLTGRPFLLHHVPLVSLLTPPRGIGCPFKRLAGFGRGPSWSQTGPRQDSWVCLCHPEACRTRTLPPLRTLVFSRLAVTQPLSLQFVPAKDPEGRE